MYILTLQIGGLRGLAAVLFHLPLDFFQDRITYSAAAVSRWWRILLVIFKFKPIS